MFRILCSPLHCTLSVLLHDSDLHIISLITNLLPVNAVSVSGAEVLTLLLTTGLFAIAELLVCLSVDTSQSHIFVLSSVSTSVL